MEEVRRAIAPDGAQIGTVLNKETAFNDAVLWSLDHQYTGIKMPNGDPVIIVDTRDDEFKVIWHGQEGWVKKHHIQAFESVVPVVRGFRKGDAVTILNDAGDQWYQDGVVSEVFPLDSKYNGYDVPAETILVEYQLGTKYVFADKLEAIVQHQVQQSKVGIALQTDGHAEVALRESPNHGEILAMVPNGDRVNILQAEGESLKVQWRTIRGWAKACNVQDTFCCNASGGKMHGPRCNALMVDAPSDQGGAQSLLQSDATRFLRRTWLEKLSTSGGILPRRQDAPEEAFIPADDASKIIIQLGAPQNNSTGDSQSNPTIVIISYAWLARVHPDSRAFHLNTLALWWRALAPIPWDDAVFWDFRSLYQVPRDDEQNRLFLTALSGMHLLYSLWGAHGLQLVDVPVDAENAIPYCDRGWPTFESAILGSGGMRDVLAISADGEASIATPPPVHPDRFAQILTRKQFTSRNADLPKVIELYRKIWPQLVRSPRLRANNWGDEELKLFFEVSMHMPNLGEICLYYHDSIFCDGKGPSEDILAELTAICDKRGMQKQPELCMRHKDNTPVKWRFLWRQTP